MADRRSAATIRTRRGVFATPRCRISMRSIRSLVICCATRPTPTTPCRNAICGRSVISTAFRGPAIKPWLFAILRNVCRAEYARRSGAVGGRRGGRARRRMPHRSGGKPQESPETEMLRQLDARDHPPAGGGAAGPVPRGDRAARDQRSVLPRHRRGRRRTGRHRDVASGTRALHAARGMARRKARKRSP